ncbi:MAG TPA: phosphopentomutase [Kiritimatiellae bacterium]|nr:phosphopentomutase [Kiritimatiellia bacterium]
MKHPTRRRVFLIVLDSVGIAPAPDAAQYGDQGAATLPHTAAAVGGLRLPTLQAMGLGNIPQLLQGGLPIRGVPPASRPTASYGALCEQSEGKDTITGHWELAGVLMRPGFTLFPPGPPSFPEELLREFERRTGRPVIGNKAASGTEIIQELGQHHMREGAWIVYTSADSVFQVAAHLDVVPLDELYRACEIARKLCNPYRVGRVIARPFTGKPGHFVRTEDRRDYAFQPDQPTVLEELTRRNIPVYAVGKIEDIFAHRGITEAFHTGNNPDSQDAVLQLAGNVSAGLIFANFIDFDMLYGHRRNPQGYARALEECDPFFAQLLPRLQPGDLLLVTADHGNDPTYKGTDHTREIVPLLAYRPGAPAQRLGLRAGFFDVGQTIAGFFGIPPLPHGRPLFQD